MDELSFLFRDLLKIDPKPEILDWSGAFEYKCRVARYFHARCREATKKLPETLAKETSGIAMPATGGLLDETRTYLECFFYFTTSAFDILAKLTREFYTNSSKAIGSRYFKQTIRFFLETDPCLDEGFSRILSQNKDWILSVYGNRDILAHADSAFIAFDKDKLVVFEARNPNDVSSFREKKLENLLPYLEDIIAKMDTFLNSYVQHFRQIVPDSDITRMLRKQQKAA